MGPPDLNGLSGSLKPSSFSGSSLPSTLYRGTHLKLVGEAQDMNSWDQSGLKDPDGTPSTTGTSTSTTWEFSLSSSIGWLLLALRLISELSTSFCF